MLSELLQVTVPLAAAPSSPPDRAAIEEGLNDRGVLVGESRDRRVVDPVAVGLRMLAGSALRIAVDVGAPQRALRAQYTLAGPLGASLIELAGGAVELSLFPAVALADELVRAVPPVEDVMAARRGIIDALGDGDEPPLSGRLPLAALEEFTVAAPLAANVDDLRARLGLTRDEWQLAQQLTLRTGGVLVVTLTSARDDDIAVGQVVWLAAGDGWLGLRPDPDGSGRRMMCVEPVQRSDIGSWVAPHLLPVLAATR
ncbi:hypothetical protein [Dactylosporangium sp. CA-139066]|uniref:hypothetical protein n=1 Tax=Dactylosporangium sp. CA-139066 TaxID=3239930 RepID=UPI003D8F45FB